MANSLDGFLAALGDEVENSYEETFDLFTNAAPLPSLGMVDPNATSIELTIAGRDFTVTQSPGLLHSNQKLGTTGAAVWQTSVKVAEWLASPKHVLFENGILDANSTVLELGSGTSGIIASTLAPLVAKVVATDQQHLLKNLRANLDANAAPTVKFIGRKAGKAVPHSSLLVTILALDWETDDIPKHLDSHGLGAGVDLVLACDCVYNYALIEPFVQACADTCSLRNHKTDESASHGEPCTTICLVAQQLRSSDVFEQWLEAFIRRFRVWRVPDEMLTAGLKEGGRFVVHAGILH
ncbi:Ribosomal protein lysine methyltransferase [Elasticomyces elasticus]|nr:Ribosomal protein lysine methyltransferase [Elasticomyces elasticus]KAK4928751.1 Ribosomal protein lysine methyltransferase [Elasticomyces elasticus]KAK5766622.1 Ribosomal protein lysine methyltransferase [Elasticomyces elasticus]